MLRLHVVQVYLCKGLFVQNLLHIRSFLSALCLLCLAYDADFRNTTVLIRDSSDVILQLLQQSLVHFMVERKFP